MEDFTSMEMKVIWCFHLISDHIDEIFIPYIPDSLYSVIRGDNIQLITYILINDVGVCVCISLVAFYLGGSSKQSVKEKEIFPV